MARPQQPELARSGKTDIDPDHVATGLQGQPTPATGGETGPVPPENQPGHHPIEEQDKPDLDAFGMSAPQPDSGHDQHHEPRLVALALLPLRETVKRLEQLDRSLTERLAKQRRSARGNLGPKGR